MKPFRLPKDYPAFLASVKERVAAARLHAVRVVNYDIVLLYWDLGHGIVEKQKDHAWGDRVIERMGFDLRRAFPGMSGFSSANLWRMKQFYLAHTTPEFLSQAVRELGGRLRAGTGFQKLSQAVRELVARVPWGHHANHLAKLRDPAARFYYLRAVGQLGWTRSVLLNQIKAGAFERAVKEKKTHNFALALPEHFAEQAEEVLKSRYSLEFISAGRALKERELEDKLIERLQQFILELGYGFCFVGRQYRLALGGKEYFVDLLFYHRFLKALVAFDLKLNGFEPEHAGKMDFYLNVLNATERAVDDRPSIGIILCAEKHDIEVEFALKTKNNPIGVAEYELKNHLPAKFKGRLPTAKQLADAMREALP